MTGGSKARRGADPTAEQLGLLAYEASCLCDRLTEVIQCFPNVVAESDLPDDESGPEQLRGQLECLFVDHAKPLGEALAALAEALTSDAAESTGGLAAFA